MRCQNPEHKNRKHKSKQSNTENLSTNKLLWLNLISQLIDMWLDNPPARKSTPLARSKSVKEIKDSSVLLFKGKPRTESDVEYIRNSDTPRKNQRLRIIPGCCVEMVSWQIITYSSILVFKWFLLFFKKCLTSYFALTLLQIWMRLNPQWTLWNPRGVARQWI